MEDRNDIMNYLVQLNERQKTIFNRLVKIEKRLDQINGKVAEHDVELTKVMTWGAFVVIVLPIVINYITR
jgi:hypothetical protein|tara:strand:+ start:135 stop:344 length:210 start_codon:yes stop_codon:yes gene_type:complete